MVDECGKGAGHGASPPRKLIRGLLTNSANILPEPANGVVRVHILGLGNDACDR